MFDRFEVFFHSLTAKDRHRFFILSVATLILFLAILGLGSKLTRGPIAIGPRFYVEYGAYAASSIFFIHFGLFLVNFCLGKRGSRHRKRLAKYVEYCYAALLAVSLAQIFFSSARVADYLNATMGDERQLWEDVRERANAHVIQDCPKGGLFTEGYCQKMKRIAAAPDTKSYVLDSVVNDREFLYHIIRRVPVGPRGTAEIHSDIAGKIERLQSKLYYNEFSSVGNNLFGWIAMLLLPLGIGLRLTKTSLELFGDLDREPAQTVVPTS